MTAIDILTEIRLGYVAAHGSHVPQRCVKRDAYEEVGAAVHAVS